MRNYENRLQKLYERKYGNSDYLFSSVGDTALNHQFSAEKSVNFRDAFHGYSSQQKYLREAMEEVPASYTQVSIDLGNKIIGHLETGLSEKVSFRFQGSVACNTHIRQYSDVDVLVIIEKFYTLEPPQVPRNPYMGNPNQDMKNLRNECFTILQEIYKQGDTVVDNSGAKSICLSGGNLRRNVDVVPANWYDTCTYSAQQLEYLRGVQIYDIKKNKRQANFPFLTKEYIERKDSNVSGNYRRIVRLTKTLKADSDNPLLEKLSSYDIQSIFYCIPDQELVVNSTFDLIYVAKDFLEQCIRNYLEFTTFDVIDGTRKISEKVSKEMLKALLEEFEYQISDLMAA